MNNRYLNKELLQEVRDNAIPHWEEITVALGYQIDSKRSKPEEIWCWSVINTENTPSMHIKSNGEWYDFSGGTGGNILELIQKTIRTDIYSAGRWLLDRGLSSCSDHRPVSQSQEKLAFRSDNSNVQSPPREKTERRREKKAINLPCRLNLVPLLSTEHPEFARRGISKRTFEALGCGFLPIEKLKNPNHRLGDRLVFQVRTVDPKTYQPVILSHIGRATTDQQRSDWGKWTGYSTFSKTLDLYGIDLLFINGEISHDLRNRGEFWIVEGAFDVAKLFEAGIFNVVGTFGASLSEEQAKKIDWLARLSGIQRIKIWYDRDPKDQKGETGQAKAIELLQTKCPNSEISGFDWNQKFISGSTVKTIPQEINDPCDFSVPQLQWLRRQNVI